MAAAVVLFVMAGALNAIVLTSALDSAIDKGLIVRGYLRSFALGMFAPSKVGELSYAHYLAGDGRSYGLGLAVLLLDKGVTFVLSALAGSLALVYFGSGWAAALTAAAAVSLILAAVAAIRNEPLRRWVRTRLLGENEADFRRFSHNVVCLLRDHRPAVAADVALTIVRMLLQAAAVCLGFRGFHTEVELLPALGIMAAVQLIGWIPVTISGLGLVQGAAVVLFAAFLGIDKAITLDLFLLLALTAYLTAAFVFLLLGWRAESLEPES